MDQEGDQFTVVIPPRRWDIKIKADVAEEVARIYGLNNLPNSLPEGDTLPGGLNKMPEIQSANWASLAKSNFNEAINYSLVLSHGQQLCHDGQPGYRRPCMSEDHQTLRKST